MSRTGWSRRVAGRPARLALPLGLGLAIAAGLGSWPSRSTGQEPAPIAPAPTSGPSPGPVPESPSAAPTIAPKPAVPELPHDVQVVRFTGPEGSKLEVLGPAPEAVPVGDGQGLATVGLKVGMAYKLRLSELPDRPGVELFPTIEILGHLHRPNGIDPAKYPIRVVFRPDDIDDAVGRGLLVTQVVYLEDPEQAVPLKLPKDDPPVVTLSPAEEPYKVARALGRVMAVVRIGGRKPTPEELAGPAGIGMANAPCPYRDPSAEGGCKVPCGPPACAPPAPGRMALPRDEFLCDGGDQGEPVHFPGDGSLAGLDPRDTVVNFNAGDRPRLLPTNVVCVYAPRFASVRVAIGASEAQTSTHLSMADLLQRQELALARQGTKKLEQGQQASISRERLKATGLSTRVYTGEQSECRVLGGLDNRQNIVMHELTRGVAREKSVVGAKQSRTKIKADGLKTLASPTVTGMVQGANQTFMSWPPKEVAGSEPPARRPGLAVIKRVDLAEAEPGDVLTYIIQYRNMGNVPIRAVSIVDSLLPRLEYVPSSAQGPAGTIFTFGENKAGAMELRYDLPGAIEPGAEGAVTFKAVVR